jgi:hypothetical protein
MTCPLRIGDSVALVKKQKRYCVCLFSQSMKKKIPCSVNFVCAIAVGFTAIIFAVINGKAQMSQDSKLASPPVVSPRDKLAISSFDRKVKGYIKLRNQLKNKAPKLSRDSTPEQLQSYRTSLEQSLRAARAGAKRGDLFMPDLAEYIRRTLKVEFQGKDRKEIREIAFETELQGVVLRINYPYAQSAELSEMPATLLSKLPPLPKEIRYRFVGGNMLLVDRETNLIIDYMPDALP